MQHCLPIVLFLSLCVVFPSRASIVYSGLQNIAIPLTFDGVYLDLDTGSHSSSVITGWDFNPFFGGQGIANAANLQPLRVGTGPLDAYRTSALGSVISVGSLYWALGEGGTDSSHVGTGPGQFHPGEEGILGFAFTPDGGSSPYYGWMRLDLSPGTNEGIIRDWAYNTDTGEGILAGMLEAVPEPSQSILTAAGLVVLLFRRTRTCRESVQQAT